MTVRLLRAKEAAGPGPGPPAGGWTGVLAAVAISGCDCRDGPEAFGMDAGWFEPKGDELGPELGHEIGGAAQGDVGVTGDRQLADQLGG